MIKWAAETGPFTAKMVEELLTCLVHPAQGYRRCLGIISLSKAYGTARVESACRRALACQAISYQSVKMILKNNLDGAELPEPVPGGPSLKHGNIRGAGYYADTAQLSLESEVIGYK
jgi:hypothetical protein